MTTMTDPSSTAPRTYLRWQSRTGLWTAEATGPGRTPAPPRAAVDRRSAPTEDRPDQAHAGQAPATHRGPDHHHSTAAGPNLHRRPTPPRQTTATKTPRHSVAASLNLKGDAAQPRQRTQEPPLSITPSLTA
ncbi:hypothetical protein [Glycomyces buryatensis]|uniref:Uncharacterized protein n=1 Tax=Glycomyces buryatensis TaxID=2570927 RepID=A0A4S8QFT6_9ACTN|nr:hypothetical protein [Glycomyces buryatensis]THV40189.1 hypothetical protein FAB82_15965 [Glycomyces buryatensis]